MADEEEVTEETMSLLDVVEGGIDPICNITVAYLILKSDTFIIYLDPGEEVCWSTTPEYGTFANDFGLVVTRTKLLENLVDSLFDKVTSKKFKVLIAEGFARILDDKDSVYSMKMLNQVEEAITKQGRQILKTRYIAGSIATTAACISIFFASWLLKPWLENSLGHNAFIIFLASLCGGFGAFVSSFLRTLNFDGDLRIPGSVYVLDGFLRIFYGCVAGFIIVLAIRSNALLGFLDDAQQPSLSLFCFFATMAGASEALIPSIIKKIEDKV